MLRLFLILCAGTASAETLVAVRTVPARAVVGPEDVEVTAASVEGALADPALAVGLEARVALYPGRPIRAGDLVAPALVERNQVIALRFRQGSLVIEAEGRALDRAGAGEAIRVMNLDSRATVTAILDADGVAYVNG